MKKRSTMKYKEVGNIEKNMFVIFVCLKQSEKERKHMATNY